MEPTESIDRFLRALAQTAVEDRGELDRLDDVAGDGDFGSTLARGAAALAAEPPSGEDAATALREAGNVLTGAMGGTSGPLFGVALIRAAHVLGDADGGGLDAALAGRMVRAAVEGVQEFGGAEPGDKTLVDALLPLAAALEDGRASDAVEEAEGGVHDTAASAARRGRASYAGERSSGEPDPGATGVAAIARRFADGELPDWETLAGRLDDAGGDGDVGRAHGFVNRPADLVGEALDGFAAAHPDLVERLSGRDVIVRRGGPVSGEVAVVSGGGAGHEPMHAGFVGAGMLHAACPGAVFTSPSPDQILAATQAVDGGAGILHLVKNYTGDVLNFRLAAEQAGEQGAEVATVIVADDVALEADSATGRRGTGVIIAAEKIAGARAAAGASLDEVRAIAERVCERGRSFGVAVHGDEVELGVGIHGEPGRPLEPKAKAAELAGELVAPILEELEPSADHGLLVLLSGLGGTPPLELYVLFAEIRGVLAERGHEVARSLVGDMITSLDQAGAALSIVALDEELTAAWDAPVLTPSLRWG